MAILRCCDFCAKSEVNVSMLVSAEINKSMVYICDECAVKCVEIFNEKRQKDTTNDE